MQSLIAQYAAGQETALRSVLDRLGDAAESTRLRLEAFAILAQLRPAARRSLLERLSQDASASVRQRAASFETAGAAAEPPGGIGHAASLAELASSDYAVWNRAVHRLAGCGSAAVQPLLDEMQSRAHDPEYCKRAGMALKALGPRRAAALAAALDHVEEPLPLQVLVEVIGALGDKPLIYRLKGLIDRLASRPMHPHEANGWDPMQRVRAKAHLELARVGSRVAVQDLREALSDPDRRIEVEMLGAVELIGTRDEIRVLLQAYEREDAFMRDRIAHVVRAIMKRERIRRNNPLFRSLPQAQREALGAILPASAGSRKSRTSAAAPAGTP
jgi:HEAT repeat protein